MKINPMSGHDHAAGLKISGGLDQRLYRKPPCHFAPSADGHSNQVDVGYNFITGRYEAINVGYSIVLGNPAPLYQSNGAPTSVFKRQPKSLKSRHSTHYSEI